MEPNSNSMHKPIGGRSKIPKGVGLYWRFLRLLTGALDCFELVGAGKVYFIAGHYDVKLQADNHVRWDVAERLNRKQKLNI